MKEVKSEGSGARTQSNLVFRSELGIHAHISVRPSKCKIFDIPEFAGMSCMDIANTKRCEKLFSMSGSRVLTTNKNHPIMIYLGNLYEVEYPEGPKITKEEMQNNRKAADQGKH